MTQWLFDLGAARALLTIQSTNTASAAVARRAGFVHEGTLRRHGVWQGQRQDVDVYAALPGEWAEEPNSSAGQRCPIDGVSSGTYDRHTGHHRSRP